MTPFRRYRPAIVVLHSGIFAMALFFGLAVLRGGSPVTPEIYGSIVYSIPALTWVALQMTIAGGALIAAVIKRSKVCAVFSYALSIYFCVFAALASVAGAEGTILMAGAVCLTAPQAFLAGLVSWGWRVE